MEAQSKKTIIISLGGSIICPKEGEINVDFLKQFKKLIFKFLKNTSLKFIVVTGGGRTNRMYVKAAMKIGKVCYEDADWLGIHTTRLNGHLLRTIFAGVAYPVLIDDPHKIIKGNPRLLIATGWRPGWSTDYIAVLLAKRFGTKEIINAGNIPFVYKGVKPAQGLCEENKDLKEYKKAFPVKEISWDDYRKLVGSKWTPRLSSPIDPIAAKEAQKLKIRALIFKGTELKNFEKVILGKEFKGTIIRP